MPTLPELLAQHREAHEAYCKLYAASKAVGKRLLEAGAARSAVRKVIAQTIGPMPVGTLVMTLTGSRFFEVTQPLAHTHLSAAPVYKHNGECKVSGKGTQYVYKESRPIEGGSVIPVPHDHPVYVKWEKRRFRDKLEGKE